MDWKNSLKGLDLTILKYFISLLTEHTKHSCALEAHHSLIRPGCAFHCLFHGGHSVAQASSSVTDHLSKSFSCFVRGCEILSEVAVWIWQQSLGSPLPSGNINILALFSAVLLLVPVRIHSSPCQNSLTNLNKSLYYPDLACSSLHCFLRHSALLSCVSHCFKSSCSASSPFFSSLLAFFHCFLSCLSSFTSHSICCCLLNLCWSEGSFVTM